MLFIHIYFHKHPLAFQLRTLKFLKNGCHNYNDGLLYVWSYNGLLYVCADGIRGERLLEHPRQVPLVADCHSWLLSFCERKSHFGLAPATIVTIQKHAYGYLKLLNGNRPTNYAWLVSSGTPSRKRWMVEEEEALWHVIHRFGPGNLKEIKEHEPLFKSISIVQEQNEAERLALDDLESILIKHRRRVEKQRRWSET